jgi:hypothetical protein
MTLVSRKRSEGCLSDLLLDMLIAGDVAHEVETRARTHARDCAPCQDRWTELARDAESASLPALRAARSGAHAVPRAPASLPRRRVGRAPLGWLALAAAAACALLVFQRLDLRDAAPAGERRKGSGRLGFFVQRAGEVSRGGPGELLRPGDAVQFTFFAPSPGYLLVLGREASGAVGVYYPVGEVAAPVVAGEQVLALSSLLDDSLGEETIEAVFCAEQRDVATLRAARQSPGGAVPDGCSIDELRILKEKP